MPVIAWMLFIFGASTDLGSAANSGRILIPVLRWFNPNVSAAAIETAQLIVRKGAHLTEYAIFALLLLRAFRSHARGIFVRQAALVLFFAALYAASDEFHQSFVATRTPSPYDVMIDTCGALLGLVAYRLLFARGNDRPPQGIVAEA